MTLEKIGFKDKDGNIFDVVVYHPITKVVVATGVILILIIVAGVVMRVIKYTVKEYKNLRATMNISTIDRVAPKN